MELNMPDPRTYRVRTVPEEYYPPAVTTRYEPGYFYEDSYLYEPHATVEYIDDDYAAGSYAYVDGRGRADLSRYPVVKGERRGRDDSLRRNSPTRHRDEWDLDTGRRSVLSSSRSSSAAGRSARGRDGDGKRGKSDATREREMFISKQDEKLSEQEKEIRSLKKQLAQAKNNQRSFGTRTEACEIARLKREVEKLKGGRRGDRDRDRDDRAMVVYTPQPSGRYSRPHTPSPQHGSRLLNDSAEYYYYDNGYHTDGDNRYGKLTPPRRQHRPNSSRDSSFLSDRHRSDVSDWHSRRNREREMTEEDVLKNKERGWGAHTPKTPTRSTPKKSNSQRKQNDKYSHVKSKLYDYEKDEEFLREKERKKRIAAAADPKRNAGRLKNKRPGTGGKSGNNSARNSPVRHRPGAHGGEDIIIADGSQPAVVRVADGAGGPGYRSYVSRVWYDDPRGMYLDEPTTTYVDATATPTTGRVLPRPPVRVVGGDTLLDTSASSALDAAVVVEDKPLVMRAGGGMGPGRYISENRRVIGENVYTLPPEQPVFTTDVYYPNTSGYVMDSGEVPVPVVEEIVPLTAATETF
eukprot:TRINITY_DN76207_c0_g1_i1.p1 TRINITY_DN76207_c0_g1~~TRINITY_DN76207_c0_g1_i1.p1  ORF type:complete len:576 (-),score=68.72 TRINITY_DN76207_c0_g1_i1:160-1887(-)